MSRGFAVSAGLDPAIAEPLAARCAELGYGSMWSGDHGADGVGTLGAFANGAPGIGLGLVVDLEERGVASVVEGVERVGLDPGRLTIAVAAGDAGAAEEAVTMVRSGLDGARVLLVLRSPRDLSVAADGFDGALALWMTPSMLEASRLELTAHTVVNPNFVGVVHAAVGADAETRLGREEGFARSLAANLEHFSQLTDDPGRTGVAVDTAPEMPAALEPYAATTDELVVRALAARRLWHLDRLATAAAPGQADAESRPTSSSVSRETTAPNAK
jgi:hypothetical protein